MIRRVGVLYIVERKESFSPRINEEEEAIFRLEDPPIFTERHMIS